MGQSFAQEDVQDLPVPVNPLRRRLESIDILRGLLMILMAIDHSRDFFTYLPPSFDPTDPARSWPALFLTRWVTHLCAPGFIALAGVSVYLQRRGGKTAAQMERLLLTRGLWLCFLEITVISFGWSFALGPGLQVIWAIGISMMFLGLLQRLPVAVVGAIGAVIVVGHNLLDGVKDTQFGASGIWWDLLHHPAPLIVHGQMVGFEMYPVVPWVGVICLGYWFGRVAGWGVERRERAAAGLGAVFLAAFCVLRVGHGYGDAIEFGRTGSTERTAMSFLEVTKYPPSLDYLLATLGVILLAYAGIDWAVRQGWGKRVRGVVEVYGRVPFFYYVLHIYLIHALALAVTAYEGLNWRFWTVPGSVFIRHLPGWGFGLGGVYLVWALVVAVLYLPCVWFAQVKARRRDWWLSYL